jgi:hypothetical protein
MLVRVNPARWVGKFVTGAPGSSQDARSLLKCSDLVP